MDYNDAPAAHAVTVTEVFTAVTYTYFPTIVRVMMNTDKGLLAPMLGKRKD